jgi:hypothetical protein
MKPAIIPEEVTSMILERFALDAETGKIYWKSIYSANGLGSELPTYIKANGYKCINIAGRQYLQHRLVWLLAYGKWPENVIDHIDGVRDNNCLTNLRDVSLSVNSHNCKAKGTYYNKPLKQWISMIDVNRARIHLGCYKTEEEARAAYEAAKKLHGLIHR